MGWGGGTFSSLNRDQLGHLTDFLIPLRDLRVRVREPPEGPGAEKVESRRSLGLGS